MAISSNTTMVLNSRDFSVRPSNQGNQRGFIGIYKEIGRLIVKREKLLKKDLKLVDLHCDKCLMSLQGQYPRFKANIFIKEFRREHNHIEKEGGVFKWISQMLHLSV